MFKVRQDEKHPMMSLWFPNNDSFQITLIFLLFECGKMRVTDVLARSSYNSSFANLIISLIISSKAFLFFLLYRNNLATIIITGIGRLRSAVLSGSNNSSTRSASKAGHAYSE